MTRDDYRSLKRPYQSLAEEAVHESANDDSSVDPEPEDVEPFVPKRKVNGWDLRESIPLQPGEMLTNEEIEAMLGFCCHTCGCSNSKKKRFEGNAYIVPDTTSLWHRRCCHNLYDEPGSDWLPPLDKAEVRAQEVVEHDPEAAFQVPEPKLVQKPKKWLHQKYKTTSKSQESELYNDDELEDPIDLLRTNEDYVKNEQVFTKITEAATMSKQANTFDREPATVLDTFAGIGGAVVSLKRLEIAMKKVIHVEHDKVATHVYKHRHDPSYNKDLSDDGIQHIYYDTFEFLEGNIDAILKKHGPFDIVVGGPPCVDYADVNANREGVVGQQGQYLPRLGRLINKINKRMRVMGRPNILFLAENTVLKNAKDLPLQQGDLEVVKDAFDISWELVLDSRSLSPIRRNRTYLSNIPLGIEPSDVIDPRASTCLDDNFDLPGTLFEKNMIAKANGLMASQGRIDDSRMCVYREYKDPKKKRKSTHYEERTLSVVERERLMGFPEGYISGAVDILFSVLCDEGLGKRLKERKLKCNWKDCLPQQYYHFSGDYPGFRGKHGSTFRFVDNPAYPIKLKLAPPLTTSAPSFFAAEGYAKRLIGNSFSIVTVDILLRPLQHLFPSREYLGYSKNKFKWQEVNTSSSGQGEANEEEEAIEASVSALSPAHAVGNRENTCAKKEPPQDATLHSTTSYRSDSSEDRGNRSSSTLGEVGPSYRTFIEHTEDDKSDYDI